MAKFTQMAPASTGGTADRSRSGRKRRRRNRRRRNT
jgi:hypothetical protein